MIGANFRWPGWTKQVAQCVKQCQLCQEYMIPRQEAYSKVPLFEGKEDIDLWCSVHLDMTGPWKVQFRHTTKSNIYNRK
eukprot:6876535-Ditylum_brightwellii.AAC.1